MAKSNIKKPNIKKKTRLPKGVYKNFDSWFR